METFIETDTANIELFFNIFTSKIEIFFIPWDQLLYHYVIEVSRQELDLLCDIHFHISIILKMLTLTRQEFLEV